MVSPKRSGSMAASFDQDRLRLLVERDLLAWSGSAAAWVDQRVELRVAVLDVVVAAAADEQTELVVRVRVVGTPAVAGDVVLTGRALLEEDAEVAADLLGLETERLAPGLGQERDARLVAGAGVEAELELAEVSGARRRRARRGPLSMCCLGGREVERIRIEVLV